MYKENEIPIWTQFGIQILLGLQYIMDFSMGKGDGPNVSYNNLYRHIEE